MADVYEKDLAQKTSLTTSDYIRVVGSDNVSYKQPINSVGDITKTRVFLSTSGDITASNIDSYTTDGIYQGFIQLGTPFSPSSWGTLTVVHANSLVIEQIISTRYYMAQRHYEGDSWTEWTLFPTRAEVDAITPTYTDVTATTTSTGAFSIPTALQSKPIIDVYPANITAIALRRDSGYFMIKDASSMTALANTSITLRIWHY